MDRRRSSGGDERRLSLIPMQQLDPSPIDSPADEKDDSYFPPSDSTPPQISHPSVLGLHVHSAVYYLTQIQKYSSYTFTAFLTLHITNTSIIPLVTHSVPDSEPYLLLTRPYYQSTLTEPLLVALPLLAHVGSGVALRLYRRHISAKRYGYENREQRRKLRWPRLSGTSALGYALVPLVWGHGFLNRILPLWVEGGSSGVGLSYVSHGFSKAPLTSYLGFTTLISVGAWHICWGAATWLGLKPGMVYGKRRRRWRFWAVNAMAVVLAGGWMAGGLGIVGRGGKSEGWVGRGYDELYARIPAVGVWF